MNFVDHQIIVRVVSEELDERWNVEPSKNPCVSNLPVKQRLDCVWYMQVKKTDVDEFHGGDGVPMCLFCARWKGEEVELLPPVKLQFIGAKSPDDFCTLNMSTSKKCFIWGGGGGDTFTSMVQEGVLHSAIYTGIILSGLLAIM